MDSRAPRLCSSAYRAEAPHDGRESGYRHKQTGRVSSRGNSKRRFPASSVISLGWSTRPTFTVLVDTRQGHAGLEDTIALDSQTTVPILRGACALRFGANFAAPRRNAPAGPGRFCLGETFIVFIQSGQRLASNALYEFATAINQHPEIDLVYGDEDSVSASGSRREPFHKPGWSPTISETFNYIGFPACFRSAIARGCFDDDGYPYDFVLRFTERTTKVLHVPKILGHAVEKTGVWRKRPLAKAAALDIKALSGRLSRTGRSGFVYDHELHKGCYGIRLDLRRSPLVSVVIPTAGRTVYSRRTSDRPHRERDPTHSQSIHVQEHRDHRGRQRRSLGWSTRASWLAECRRITYADPTFNVARKLNLGRVARDGRALAAA